MTVDPEHAHPVNTITKLQKDHLPVHIKHPGSPKTGSTNKSPLMTCLQSTSLMTYHCFNVSMNDFFVTLNTPNYHTVFH